MCVLHIPNVSLNLSETRATDEPGRNGTRRMSPFFDGRISSRLIPPRPPPPSRPAKSNTTRRRGLGWMNGIGGGKGGGTREGKGKSITKRQKAGERERGPGRARMTGQGWAVSQREDPRDSSELRSDDGKLPCTVYLCVSRLGALRLGVGTGSTGASGERDLKKRKDPKVSHSSCARAHDRMRASAQMRHFLHLT
jgi:hypothetical protein